MKKKEKGKADCGGLRKFKKGEKEGEGRSALFVSTLFDLRVDDRGERGGGEKGRSLSQPTKKRTKKPRPHSFFFYAEVKSGRYKEGKRVASLLD